MDRPTEVKIHGPDKLRPLYINWVVQDMKGWTEEWSHNSLTFQGLITYLMKHGFPQLATSKRKTCRWGTARITVLFINGWVKTANTLISPSDVINLTRSHLIGGIASLRQESFRCVNGHSCWADSRWRGGRLMKHLYSVLLYHSNNGPK